MDKKGLDFEKFENLLVKKDVFCVTPSGKFFKKRHFAGSDCLKWLEMSYLVKLRLTEPG